MTTTLEALEKKAGSVFGGTLLVAGCCIGAGMLALPILTGLCGFFPSLALLLVAWAFMTFSALLLVEINGRFKGQVNLLTMTEALLGPIGRRLCWCSYLFLFYALLVAYTSASGALLSAVCSDYLGVQVPLWTSSVLFAAFFGSVVYLGTRPVDLLNRALMAALIAAYCGMVALGISKIEPKHLLHSDLRYALLPLPVLVISFGFQNMIPSLHTYMRGDLKRLRLTIFCGSLLALFVYVIWSLLFLGAVAPETIRETYVAGEEAASALRRALGTNLVSSFATAFAFFAIVTSFLAQGLSLTHFISDGWKILSKKRENGWIALLAIAPPALFAVVYPQIFFKALSFAGGICAMILFGILPVLMAAKARKDAPSSAYRVRGGKAALCLAFLFSLFVIFGELSRLFGLSRFFLF